MHELCSRVENWNSHEQPKSTHPWSDSRHIWEPLLIHMCIGTKTWIRMHRERERERDNRDGGTRCDGNTNEASREMWIEQIKAALLWRCCMPDACVLSFSSSLCITMCVLLRECRCRLFCYVSLGDGFGHGLFSYQCCAFCYITSSPFHLLFIALFS